MKNKLTVTLLVFLLLVPLRLPVSILFIRFFKWVLGETTSMPLPVDVVATNVIVTKIVYNLALSSVFLYNIEMISRQQLGRKPGMLTRSDIPDPFYWWCVPIAVMLLVFVVMDAVNINSIFFN
jgi:hypothetical protein